MFSERLSAPTLAEFSWPRAGQLERQNSAGDQPSLGVASGLSLSDTKSLVLERYRLGSGNAGGLFPLIFRTVKTVYILSGGGRFRAKLQKDLALHLWQVLAAAIERADRGQGDRLGFSRAPHTHGKEEPN